MSKQINSKEIIEICQKILSKDSQESLDFMTAIAEAICDFGDGFVHDASVGVDGEKYVGIVNYENDPSSIWFPYDPESEL